MGERWRGAEKNDSGDREWEGDGERVKRLTTERENGREMDTV